MRRSQLAVRRAKEGGNDAPLARFCAFSTPSRSPCKPSSFSSPAARSRSTASALAEADFSFLAA